MTAVAAADAHLANHIDNGQVAELAFGAGAAVADLPAQPTWTEAEDSAELKQGLAAGPAALE